MRSVISGISNGPAKRLYSCGDQSSPSVPSAHLGDGVQLPIELVEEGAPTVLGQIGRLDDGLLDLDLDLGHLEALVGAGEELDHLVAVAGVRELRARVGRGEREVLEPLGDADRELGRARELGQDAGRFRVLVVADVVLPKQVEPLEGASRIGTGRRCAKVQLEEGRADLRKSASDASDEDAR